MKLSIRQSYLAMFELLDGFYQDTKDDCLGSLLGGFNPSLFINSNSADSAAWLDWMNSVKKITVEELLTSDEALCTTRAFIDFHKKEFGFDLKWLIEELNSMSANSDKWLKSVKKAVEES